MTDFGFPWAVNGDTREPTALEIDQGFPCGAADKNLFNWLFNKIGDDLSNISTSSSILRAPFIAANSVTTTTPPANPSTGDIYIVAATATGAWTGHEKEIAWWNGAEWLFQIVYLGTIISAGDSEIYWRRTSSGYEPMSAETITNRAYFGTPGSSTFTVPTGVTKVFVTVAGGGGGGDAHQNTPIAGGTGGTSSFGAYVSATGGEGGYYGPDVREPGIGIGGDINIVGGGGIGGEGAIAFGPSQPDGVNDGVWGKNGGKAMKTVTVTPGAGITVTVGAGGAGAVSDSPNFFWTDGTYTFHGSAGQKGYVLIEW